MIEYANESVVRALKQYEMLSKSLKFTVDLDQRTEVCNQMTKIIENILVVTNKIYEAKYNKILGRSTYLMDEERNKLLELINLINERRAYVNNQISNNCEVTGINIDCVKVLGEDKIDEYKMQVKIIEKYKKNIKLDGVLKDEIANLNISIKKANDKIITNKNLNKQLEEKMLRILDNAVKELSLLELKEREKEIDLAYTELGYSLEKAKENAKIARKDCSPEIILECDNMLASITLEYERYKEKKLILQLLDIYRVKVESYDEILDKREKINNILQGIVNSDLYLKVGNELNKEYSTIKLEKQDLATLDSLVEERDNKKRMLEEINFENDSDEFKNTLAGLLENEKKYQEKLLLDKKKKDEELRLRRLEEEKRRQEEILKRQKVLEEERKKEIEERTKQLLVEKKNPILFTSKTDKKTKDEINDEEKKNDIKTKSVAKDNSTSASSRVSIKPSDDIFTRKSLTKRVDDGIPVIKNKGFNNDVVSSRKEVIREEIFPKNKLNKESDIFPSFPELSSDDSFFDDNEFKDLNKYMENDKKNDWF